jgi:hypothetical protein
LSLWRRPAADAVLLSRLTAKASETAPTRHKVRIAAALAITQQDSLPIREQVVSIAQVAQEEGQGFSHRVFSALLSVSCRG